MSVRPWLVFLLKTLAPYAGIWVLASGLIVVLFRLWEVDLRLPFNYDGDMIYSLTTAKWLQDADLFGYNPYLGAPFRGTLYDFPSSYLLHHTLVRLLLLVFKDPILAVNLYCLGSFAITSCTAFFAMRRLELPAWAALAGGLAFAFLPYHYLRIVYGHTWLSNYYMIPLVILCAIWGATGRIHLADIDVQQKRVFLRWRERAFYWTALACILVGWSGVYYAFFSVFLFVALAFRSLLGKQFRATSALLLMAAWVVLAVLLNYLPTLAFLWVHGPPVAAVVQRSPIEADIYGLKIFQMITSAFGESQPNLGAFAQNFNNEGVSSSLGTVGTVAFLYWVVHLFRPVKASDHEDSLSFMNLAALLLGLSGGFGLVVAYFFIEEIRAYNRISLFIAFISLTLFFLAASRFAERLKHANILTGSHRQKLLPMIFCGLALGSITLDVSRHPRLDATIPQRYHQDRAFLAALEERLPKDSRIFQLPYMAFPENGPLNAIRDYDFLKPYLLSNHFAWSSGGMKGRSAGEWSRYTTSLSTPRLLEQAAFVGFSGILVDRYGYAQQANNPVEAELSALIGSPSLVSNDSRMAFYDIRFYAQQQKAKYTIKQWNRRATQSLYWAVLKFERGFSALQSDGQINWRWCANRGEITITKPFDTPNLVLVMDFDVTSASGEKANFVITQGNERKRYRIGAEPIHVQRKITLTTPETIIQFYSDASRYDPGNGDPRELVFKLIDFHYEIQGNPGSQ